MNLIATMVALSVIDKIGRRKLMIVGSIGYLISPRIPCRRDVLLRKCARWRLHHHVVDTGARSG